MSTAMVHAIMDAAGVRPNPTLEDRVAAVLADLKRVTAERDEARDWVRRLTASSRVLTCAFCGEAYPPGTPESNHEALTAHVLVCAKHPMRAVEAKRDRLRADLDRLLAAWPAGSSMPPPERGRAKGGA